ncbi:centrin, putative [Theileria equi strain WA]|uniref:Calmodulin n=1 Tax=Theileria equi strain WA TaxID=1537102 RepID=L0B0A2_THEEQ|nr:centrin, putative [Theileria equi strain WA]AFZ81250.1 centrin, putative [Theileria equi strain WA]|eukprot:XP_004830916.1 centrin, putative [Theileria equi strain WA]
MVLNWLAGGDADLSNSFSTNSDASDSAESDVEDKRGRLYKNVLNRDLEKEVEEAFSLFDKDGDHVIDFFECQAAFKALRLDPSSENIKELFKELGKDESDVLTLMDFKTLVIARIHTRYTSSEVEKIFNQIQDGKGSNISNEELNLMISEASSNGDFITIEDFSRLMKRSWTGDPIDMLSDSE